MDSQLIEMIRDRFDAVDAQLALSRESFEKHAATDEAYWQKLDEAEAQVSMLKRGFWGLVSIAGVVGTWLGLKH